MKIWPISKKRWMAIVLTIYFMGVFIMDKFDQDSFRFVDFKDDESLEIFLQANFPVGSDANELLGMLKQAGAKCKTNTNYKHHKIEGHAYMYASTCRYESGFFSLHPFGFYRVIVWSDEHNKIVTPIAAERSELFNGL